MSPWRIYPTAFILATALLGGQGARAGTYMNKDQALKLAFPTADAVETKTLYLTGEQKSRLAALSGAAPESAIHTFYRGRDAGTVTGYAAIEATTVRTLPQTLLVALTPDCRVRFVEVLAFFEPAEYKPPGRWLDQFREASLSPGLRVGGDLQGITGATLSARSVARQVRKTTALCSFLENGE